MIGATLSVDEYKKSEAALREGDRLKDEFLAMLAHELRNPLAPDQHLGPGAQAAARRRCRRLAIASTSSVARCGT